MYYGSSVRHASFSYLQGVLDGYTPTLAGQGDPMEHFARSIFSDRGKTMKLKWQRTGGILNPQKEESMAFYGNHAVLITFLVPALCLTLCVGPAHAAQSSPALTSPSAAAASGLAKQPLPGKPDLTCEISAYYDSAMSKPINNTWILDGQYKNPPWIIYHRILIRNKGTAPASNVKTSTLYKRPDGNNPSQVYTTLGPVNANQTVILVQNLPFSVSTLGTTNLAGIVGRVDENYTVTESEESNNLCSYYVKFKAS
jgi:hypothetical protein